MPVGRRPGAGRAGGRCARLPGGAHIHGRASAAGAPRAVAAAGAAAAGPAAARRPADVPVHGGGGPGGRTSSSGGPGSPGRHGVPVGRQPRVWGDAPAPPAVPARAAGGGLAVLPEPRLAGLRRDAARHGATAIRAATRPRRPAAAQPRRQRRTVPSGIRDGCRHDEVCAAAGPGGPGLRPPALRDGAGARAAAPGVTARSTGRRQTARAVQKRQGAAVRGRQRRQIAGPEPAGRDPEPSRGRRRRRRGCQRSQCSERRPKGP
mmetsp:Transcript_104115/g.294969  ORF Transcript_104115/g.294969 Transcript_104115/m.294969 type:complete len:263 (+) Transcript_104115:635-1423(+)